MNPEMTRGGTALADDATTDGRRVTTFPTSLPDVKDQGTIPVHSTTEPNAAGLLKIGRSTAYAMARTGELPVIRLGGTVRVPVSRLLALLDGQQ